MGKRGFDKTKMSRNKNIRNLVDGIEDIHDNTKDKIIKLEEQTSKEKVIETIEVVKNDSLLSNENKDEIIELLYKNYIEVFNFDNCPNDYNELKKEVKFFTGMIQYNFMLLANRLKKIRDKKLYKQDGYNTFKEFINNELNITKQTVYKYIDIYQNFGVASKRLDKNIQYTKLHPIISLLKADNNDIPKEEIKNKFINEINNKTQKEIIEEVKKLKIKYGLISGDTQNNNDNMKNIKIYIKKHIPNSLSEENIEQIKELIKYLEELLK